MASKVLSLLVISLLLFSWTALAEEANPVLAKAGDYVIRKSDLDRIISYYPPDKQKHLQKNPQQKAVLVKRMIEVKVVADIAKKEGFDKRPDVKEQADLTTENFIVNEYMAKVVIKDVGVTDKDIELYYELVKGKYTVPEQARARHILIKTSKTSTDEEKGKAKARAEEILERLRKGEDFAKLAEQYSEDQKSKVKGGDLGYFSRGKMAKSFENAAFALKPGEISGIIETNFGFHILKTEDIKPARTKSLEEVKSILAEELKNQWAKNKGNEFLDKAMKAANAEIYEDTITGQTQNKEEKAK
jgi:peptidyl-prolyl cis-trans isomerase C